MTLKEIMVELYLRGVREYDTIRIHLAMGFANVRAYCLYFKKASKDEPPPLKSPSCSVRVTVLPLLVVPVVHGAAQLGGHEEALQQPMAQG